MKQILTLLMLGLILIGKLQSQTCNTDREDKVLLIGDSWATFMHLGQSIEAAMDNYGFSDLAQVSDLNLSIAGSRTTTFVNDTALLAELETEILAHPSLEFVHLSIGGNDFLGQWDISFSPAAVDSLYQEVFQNIVDLVDFIHNVNPDLIVVWSGYCYANFGDVINEVPTALQAQHPYYGAWQNMNFPNFIQINSLLRQFSDSMQVYASNHPKVEFVPAIGLMQHVYGQSTPLNVPPAGTYAAGLAPIDTGFLEYPSPAESMISLGNIPFTNIGLYDCFHLNNDAYEVFMDYQFDQYYRFALMEDQQNSPVAGLSLDSLGNIGNGLYLGKLNVEQRLFLEFNYTIPDTGIAQASLFLKRKNAQNGNVTNQATAIQVDFFYPYAGNSTAWEPSDFDATPDSSFQVCVYGDLDKNDNWLRLDLPAEAAAFLQSGQFQLRISAEGVNGEELEFYDPTDLDHAPILDLKYGPKQYQTVAHELIADSDLKIYPNPSSNGIFNLQTEAQILRIQAFNINGQELPVNFQEGKNQFQLPTDFSGLTIVQLQLANGKTAVAKLMKL